MSIIDDIDICSLRDLEQRVRDWKPNLVISAIRPDEGVTTQRAKTLLVPMDDVMNNQLRPMKNGVRHVLGAYYEPGKRMLFHCKAGVSRSAALAVMKVYQHHPDLVWEFLDKHPQAQPNPLLLLMADEMLNANGDLLERTRHRHKGRKF